MTAGYWFKATCPYDGGELEPLAGGTTTRWETRTAAQCTVCDRIHIIAVTLHADPQPARKPIDNHGTEAGYQRHRRRGGGVCRACLTAHKTYTANRKKVTGGAA